MTTFQRLLTLSPAFSSHPSPENLLLPIRDFLTFLFEVCTDSEIKTAAWARKGNKKACRQYGDALLCVRYRYDEQSQTRLKTVELIIEKKP